MQRGLWAQRFNRDTAFLNADFKVVAFLQAHPINDGFRNSYRLTVPRLTS
jgi:hypothetical protein